MNARLLLVAPLLLMGLAACGDDDSSGSSVEDFCAQATALDEGAFSALDSAESPEDVEAAVTAGADGLEDLVDSAPSELEDQVQELADVYADLRDGLEDVDWDLEAFFSSPDSADIIERLDSEDLTDLEDYLLEECDLDVNS